MAGRFPDAPDVQAFWRNLVQSHEALTSFSDDELLKSGVPRALLALPEFVRKGSIIEGADLFDAGFFGFNPREAELIDPQHRVLLECAWEAMGRLRVWRRQSKKCRGLCRRRHELLRLETRLEEPKPWLRKLVHTRQHLIFLSGPALVILVPAVAATALFKRSMRPKQFSVDPRERDVDRPCTGEPRC